MVVWIRRVPVGGGHMIQEPGLGICMALRINTGLVSFPIGKV